MNTMKQLLAVVAVVAAVVAAALVVLQYLPNPTIREDFTCGE